jgi:hypothetical protein
MSVSAIRALAHGGDPSSMQARNRWTSSSDQRRRKVFAGGKFK